MEQIQLLQINLKTAVQISVHGDGGSTLGIVSYSTKIRHFFRPSWANPLVPRFCIMMPGKGFTNSCRPTANMYCCIFASESSDLFYFLFFWFDLFFFYAQSRSD